MHMTRIQAALTLGLFALTLPGCGNSTTSTSQTTHQEEESPPSDTTDEASDPEVERERPAPAADAADCPASVPVGFVRCQDDGRTCRYEGAECLCGDHDGTGTPFWECGEVSSPTIDPETGEPE